MTKLEIERKKLEKLLGELTYFDVLTSTENPQSTLDVYQAFKKLNIFDSKIISWRKFNKIVCDYYGIYVGRFYDHFRNNFNHTNYPTGFVPTQNFITNEESNLDFRKWINTNHYEKKDFENKIANNLYLDYCEFAEINDWTKTMPRNTFYKLMKKTFNFLTINSTNSKTSPLKFV